LRILVLNYEYPPVGGGGGAVSRQVARHLAGRGHDVGVQTAHWGDLAKAETVGGVAIRRHFAFRRRKDRCSVPEMVLFILTGIWPTWRRIRRERPDLLHVHFAVPTGLLAWVLHKLTGVPYVLTAHLGDVPGGVPEQTDHWFRWIKPLTRLVWNRAAGATAVSEFVRHLAEASYRVPVRTLRNGVALPDLKEGQLEPHQPPRLMFAGRFNPQKNLLFLVEVLRILKPVPWSCRLIGDGPEMPMVKTAIAEADLEDRVVLTGWVSPAEVDDALASSDILLIPSHSEGLPVVAAKALAFGLAVVGSDIGGLRDVVVHDQNGWLLDHGDAEAFADGLGQLLRDSERLAAMRAASREHAGRFDIRKIIDDYERFFAAILDPSQK